ncbi:MAG: tRNA (adenosine(37)-N6)-threonylcarbamoyltransferase complex dimerization subunit type 1 TsaB [Lachnospiraceae bacterium]|nr:tRNA (adenosine(37)-N6)-threonylcarbamoyltransferase complex dimerization subunit type 1 TsaB [Lachnospiraceae bacterium]
MKILGIDSSGLVAGVAVIEDEQLLAEYTVNYKKTHSQTLLPMLAEISKMVELSFEEIDAIAIAAGPGSFTGLRIGSATAKGLGLAWDKPLLEVPTVDGIAYQLFGHRSLICPLMDARRNQVYTGLYRFADEEGASRFQVVKRQCAVSLDEIATCINERKEAVVFLGDGVPVYREKLRELIKVPYEFAPSYCNRQRAASVAALGAVYLAEGRTVSAREHRPDYLRLSQAERERMEKGEKLTQLS